MQLIIGRLTCNKYTKKRGKPPGRFRRRRRKHVFVDHQSETEYKYYVNISEDKFASPFHP